MASKVQTQSHVTTDQAYSEYKKLLADLKNEDATKETIYEQLMAKETNVLDLIGRVANQKNTSMFKETVLYNKSMFEIAMLFANTWKAIISEVFIEKQPLRNYPLIFYEGERKIYAGLMLVLVALFFYFVDIS